MKYCMLKIVYSCRFKGQFLLRSPPSQEGDLRNNIDGATSASWYVTITILIVKMSWELLKYYCLWNILMEVCIDIHCDSFWISWLNAFDAMYTVTWIIIAQNCSMCDRDSVVSWKRAPTSYSWLNFLYRIKVHLNECPPWNKLCVANRVHSWYWEAQPQALCMSEVRNFVIWFHQSLLEGRQMQHASWATPCSRCHVAVHSIVWTLDFEAANDSVVHYCLSNYLLLGLQITIWRLFCAWLMQKHSKEHPLPTLLFCKVLRRWVLFHQTTVIVYSYKLNSNILPFIQSRNGPTVIIRILRKLKIKDN